MIYSMTKKKTYDGEVAMAKTIAIDDDVYDTLKRFARPLEDTPSSVIRRLVEIAESSVDSSVVPKEVRITTESGPKHRVRSVERTPQAAFRHPILEALREVGGGGLVGHVLDRVREKMKDK